MVKLTKDEIDIIENFKPFNFKKGAANLIISYGPSDVDKLLGILNGTEEYKEIIIYDHPQEFHEELFDIHKEKKVIFDWVNNIEEFSINITEAKVPTVFVINNLNYNISWLSATSSDLEVNIEELKSYLDGTKHILICVLNASAVVNIPEIDIDVWKRTYSHTISTEYAIKPNVPLGLFDRVLNFYYTNDHKSIECKYEINEVNNGLYGTSTTLFDIIDADLVFNYAKYLDLINEAKTSNTKNSRELNTNLLLEDYNLLIFDELTEYNLLYGNTLTRLRSQYIGFETEIIRNLDLLVTNSSTLKGMKLSDYRHYLLAETFTRFKHIIEVGYGKDCMFVELLYLQSKLTEMKSTLEETISNRDQLTGYKHALVEMIIETNKVHKKYLEVIDKTIKNIDILIDDLPEILKNDKYYD